MTASPHEAPAPRVAGPHRVEVLRDVRGFGDKKVLVDTFKVAFQPRVLDLDVPGIDY